MKNVYVLIVFLFVLVSQSFSQITSTTLGGLWSNPATWNGGVVPTATDDVIIANDAIVTIDQDVNVLSITVGEGTSGILEYEDINPRVVTVTNDVTINGGGIFRSAVLGTVTTHVLSISGNIVNNGTLDFSTNGNTAGADIRFTGATNTSFGGIGPVTNIYTITVDKGTDFSSVVTLNPANFSFRGATSTPGFIQSFLTILNGTIEIAGTFTMDNPVFNGTGQYTVPPTGGFWLNNPNFTINARAGTAEIDGLLRVDAGVMNIGTGPTHRLGYMNGSVIIINGGEINVSSRMTATTTYGINYTQTGGTITLAIVENPSVTRASFDIQRQNDNASFTMSGGSIVLQNASTGTGNRDYYVDAENMNITGGTLQIGNANSGTAQTFYISGSAPSVVIDNTVSGHNARLLNDLNVYGSTLINTGTSLNLDAFGTPHKLTQIGTDFINSGTLDGSLVGSKLSFSGTTAQTYGGDGSITGAIDSLEINNPLGLTVTNTVPSDITTLHLAMLAGDIFTGVSTLTVGTNTAVLGDVDYVGGTVVGTFKKWFDAISDSKDFQVGIAGTTRNANINFTTAPATGGTLTAQWVSAYGGTNGLPLTEPGFPPVTDVSSDGYWTVTAGDGLTGGVYTGTFTATDVVTVIDFSQLVLVKRADASSPWILDGTHVVTTGSNTTPILSRTDMAGFSDFGIGGSITSLPVSIEYFRGSKLNTGNLLDWKVNCTSSPTATMILERSSDGRNFSSINSITASSLRCLQPFNYTDASPVSGINYYRIRVTDADGNSKFSNIIPILNRDRGFDIVSMMPNPVAAKAVLNIASAAKGNMQIVITDASGRRMDNRSVILVAGSNQVTLDLSGLAAGTYQLSGYTADGTKTIRFVKE